MKILLVDDSIRTRLLLKKTLVEAGYNNLVTAGSAAEAFEVLGLHDPAVEV